MMLCEIRCCYCNHLLGHRRCAVPKGMTPVTHGICDDCYESRIAPLERQGYRRLEADLRKEA